MTQSEIESTLARSQAAFESYKLLNLDERIAIADKFLLAFEASEDRLSQELCAQMGRPIAHCAVEVRGTIARGRHMISLARECLADSENKVGIVLSQ